MTGFKVSCEIFVQQNLSFEPMRDSFDEVSEGLGLGLLQHIFFFNDHTIIGRREVGFQFRPHVPVQHLHVPRLSESG